MVNGPIMAAIRTVQKPLIWLEFHRRAEHKPTRPIGIGTR
jgi:hypothetical protein